MIKYENDVIQINGTHSQLMYEAIGIFMYIYDMEDEQEKRYMQKTVKNLINNYYKERGIARDETEESHGTNDI